MDLRDLATDLVARARAAGARAADVLVGESEGLSVTVRLGETEKLKRARQRRAGLRVLVGDSTAIVSTADLSPAALDALVRDACALARATAPDPHAGLPDPADLAREPPDLDLYDPAIEGLEPPAALARAREAEAAALGAASEITNSEGAEFGGEGGQVAYASSLGFAGAYSGTHWGLSVSPVAARDGTMQRDSWYTAHRKLGALDPPAEVGREAARRARRHGGSSSSRPACCRPTSWTPTPPGGWLSVRRGMPRAASATLRVRRRRTSSWCPDRTHPKRSSVRSTRGST